MPTCSLYICVSRGYLHTIWGWGHLCTPYVWGWGVSAHLSSILVAVSTSNVSVCGLILTGLDISLCWLCFMMLYLSLQFHYVSGIYYHSYNYYSSGDGGVFWCVISFISYGGPLLHGASVTLGQHDVVLPQSDTRCSGGVIGLVTVTTAATFISNAS